MTWTRIGDDFNDRPDLLEVPRSARLLHVEALVYCNKHLRNGDLPKGALRRITDAEDPELDAKQLVDAGVWEETETGWHLDWSDQDDADEVRARQEYRVATQKRYRERKAKHDRGDHSMCDPRYCKVAVTGNATSHMTSHETPSRPVPSRPKDRGQGQGVAGPGAGAPARHFQEEERRWRGWEPTDEAHPFVPSLTDPNICSWESDDYICVGRHRESWEHGHAWLPVSGEFRECVKCSMPEAHAIHSDHRLVCDERSSA
jgi:hypothetical protein